MRELYCVAVLWEDAGETECIIEDDGKCYERVILCCSPMGGCRRNQSV